MLLPFLLAAAGAIHQDQFSQPMTVVQPVRLELTPTLDGTINKEEWDPFGEQTYLQWEPGRIYVAGQMPAGKDLVLSIDGKGDGWLVGRDNVEFRVTVKDGKATVTARELDATAVNAPVWRDRTDLATASEAVASTTGDVTTVEAMFDDAGLNVLPRKPKDMKLRLDITDSGDVQPYLPRFCSEVRFDDHRSTALPRGMDSGIQAKSRAVIPGESVFLRLTFHGTNAMGAKTIDLRSLGAAEDASNRLSVIFPSFDNKGRAFVDYQSKIDPTAAIGYRVVHGTISFKDGPEASVEGSYRIAPYMDFTLSRTEFDRLPDDNVLRIPYVLQLYTRQGVDGIVRISAPAGWEVTRGDGDKFRLLGNQSADGRRFELKVPADAHGTFPIKFTGQTKDRTVNQVCYVTIR
ncbi:MAG TPA: hypothetical protein VHE55_10225 [Fimbriimonadaceae bacterium]|nr:hypothetical protein [Fimbriimonadaceae bacterium]